MPKGQKNKHHNHLKNKKRNQEKGHPEDVSQEKVCHKRDDSQDHKEAHDSESVEEQHPCSSSSVPGEILEMPPASKTSSDAGCPSCVPSSLTICDDDLEFDEGPYCHCGKNSLYSDYRICHETPCKNCLDIFNEIFKKAFENIEIAFAASVIEIDSTNYFYDLVSLLKVPKKGRVCAGMGLPKTGLLMTILAMIFLKNNSVSEEDFWKFLNFMQVYPGRKHLIYREPQNLITQDFVKLKYLEYKKIPNSDPPCYWFQWGPKAYTETTKMKVLEFMAKGSGIEPSTFSIPYAEALREENQKAKIRKRYPILALKHHPGHSHHHVQKVMTPQ